MTNLAAACRLIVVACGDASFVLWVKESHKQYSSETQYFDYRKKAD